MVRGRVELGSRVGAGGLNAEVGGRLVDAGVGSRMLPVGSLNDNLVDVGRPVRVEAAQNRHKYERSSPLKLEEHLRTLVSESWSPALSLYPPVVKRKEW